MQQMPKNGISKKSEPSKTKIMPYPPLNYIVSSILSKQCQLFIKYFHYVKTRIRNTAGLVSTCIQSS